MTTKKPVSKVAQFISNALDASDKTQAQIAEEIGFPKPNVVSMIRNGITKLPLSRIPATAQALGVSETKLFRLCMDEYMPGLLEVCDDIYKAQELNSAEWEIVDRIRLKTKGRAFKLNAAAKAALNELCDAL